MSLRPRAVSAPPRGRRSRLEEVLAAGLARLSLQPADVGTRAPEKSKGKGKAPPAQYEDESGKLYFSLDELTKEASKSDNNNSFLTPEEEREVLESVDLPDRSARGAHTRFYPEQIAAMRAWIETHPRKTPGPADVEQLVAQTGLDERKIKDWISRHHRDYALDEPALRVLEAWWDKHSKLGHTLPTNIERAAIIRDAKAAGGRLNKEQVTAWIRTRRAQAKQATDDATTKAAEDLTQEAFVEGVFD